MVQYAASVFHNSINNIISYVTQNQWMILLITLGMMPFAIGIYLAIREKICTGSNEGFKDLKGFLSIPIIFILMYAAGYLIWQIRLANPYAIAFRIILAIILPSVFFGYLFAVVSNMLLATAHLKEKWKYFNHFGRSIILIWISLVVYSLLILPVIEGLSPIFLWFGIFAGLMLAPVIISKGYANINEVVKTEEIQHQDHTELGKPI